MAVLVLIDSDSLPWAWSRLVRGPGALRGTPGLGFAKVLGSGRDGGFGLAPSAARQGLFGMFGTAASAAAFVAASPVMAAYRRHARELCVATLQAYSCRGTWGGHSLPLGAAAPPGGATTPVAALTRASIHLRRSADFWRRAPAAQQAIEHAPGCRLAVGLGEAPLLRQATFSLWDSVAAMEAYARQGAHLQAIRAAQQGRHFSESMFARFVPVSVVGQWRGQRFD